MSVGAREEKVVPTITAMCARHHLRTFVGSRAASKRALLVAFRAVAHQCGYQFATVIVYYPGYEIAGPRMRAV